MWCKSQSLDEGCVSDWRLIQSGKMNLFKPAVLISHTLTPTYTPTPSLVFNLFKKWLTSAFGKVLVIVTDFGNTERKEEKKPKSNKNLAWHSKLYTLCMHSDDILNMSQKHAVRPFTQTSHYLAVFKFKWCSHTVILRKTVICPLRSCPIG